MTVQARWLPWLVGLIIFVVAMMLWPHSAAEEKTSLLDQQLIGSLPPLPASFPPIPLLAEKPTNPHLQTGAAVLIDSESGSVLYAERAETPIAIASTTKLMTAIIVRAQVPLDKVVDITPEHTAVIGSDMGLRPGEKLTVRSLLAGLLISSGNDAAWALANTVAGSHEGFVTLMNKQADEFGLTQTHFADPAGLDDSGQSTAFELSIIARAALRDPVIAELVRTKELTVTSTDSRVVHDLKNSNRLVGEFDYLGAIGLKTGFTPEAGHCLVAGADRDGHRLIAVILHTDANTITASAIEARKLLDWGWQNVRWPTNKSST